MQVKRLTVAGVALRLLRCVAIALVFLTLCSLFLAYEIHSGRNDDFPLQWFSLAAFTPLIFWSAVRVSRHYWHRPMYCELSGSVRKIVWRDLAAVTSPEYGGRRYVRFAGGERPRLC